MTHFGRPWQRICCWPPVVVVVPVSVKAIAAVLVVCCRVCCHVYYRSPLLHCHLLAYTLTPLPSPLSRHCYSYCYVYRHCLCYHHCHHYCLLSFLSSLPLLLLLQPDPSAGATRAILVEAREYALPSPLPLPLGTATTATGLPHTAGSNTSPGGDRTPTTANSTTATSPDATAGLFLSGAYYRPLCLCVRDQECVDMGRRLCMLLGR